MKSLDLTGKNIAGTLLGATALMATLAAAYIWSRPSDIEQDNGEDRSRKHYTALNLTEAEGQDVMMETCGPKCYEIKIGEFNVVRGAYEGPMIYGRCSTQDTTIKTDAKEGSELEKLANPAAVREIRDAVLKKHKGVKL